jgi:hypothetical protein
MESAFVESCAEIERAYVRLGHRMGWRFLGSPQATLNPETAIALITLNPDGSAERPDHARESSEAGSAYVVESWRHGNAPGEAPLQREVRRLFAMLAAALGEPDGDQLLHRSLAAYFVPFRSPTVDALARRRESFAFASQLWARLFQHLDPKLVITIDRGTARCLARILTEKFAVVPSRQAIPIGWGSYTAEVLAFESGDSLRTLLRLPHLSRFRVFSRPQSQPYLEHLMAVATRSLR